MIFGFKSFYIMGLSNSDVFVADKDPNDMKLKLMLVRPEFELQDEQECQTSPTEDRHPSQKQEEEEEDDDDKNEEQAGKKNIPVQVASLTIKIASGESDDIDDPSIEDGFKTPTSKDHKIPVMMECPAAPRKPKSISSSSTKRKAGILVDHDLLQDIESLFPTKPLLPDLGGKIKKVKQEN